MKRLFVILFALFLFSAAPVHSLYLQNSRALTGSTYFFIGMGNVLVTNLSYFLIPEAGFRFALSQDMDFGVRLWGLGLSADWRWQFFGDAASTFYGMAINMELGGTLVPLMFKISPALIIDLMINPDFSFYTSFRWRYLSAYSGDGFVFLPSVGIRVLSDQFMTFFVEFGVSKPSDPANVELQAGLSCRIKLK